MNPNATAAEARLGAPAEALLAFYEEPHLLREKRQFAAFLKVDLAHTVMLAEQGILTPDQAGAILSALRDLVELGVEHLSLDARHGSLLFQIEHYLFGRLGEDIGGRMHTGRSRLDQGPTARRLYKRQKLLDVFEALLGCRETVIVLAGAHRDTIMPGYTCLQHAHPTVFAHYLLAFSSKLGDDFDRLREGYRRLNRNPLGSAGLSGTSWPIDRDRTTELLGFDTVLANAKLAREAYYAAELAGALALLMSTLNDLATDLHLWSSHEFGMVETDDAFCGTSSIFPQKKNPTALEAVKFAAGGAATWLATALATFRAEGTGDVMMREVPLLDEAFPATAGSLRMMSAVMRSLRVDAARMRALAARGWSTATELADDLVRRRSLSFREAHHVVARLVRIALARGLDENTVDSATLDEAAREVGAPAVGLDDEAIRRAFSVDNFVKTRRSRGSVSPAEIERLVAEEMTSLSEAQAWLHARKEQLAAADQRLSTAIAQWTGPDADGRLDEARRRPR